MNFEKLIQNLQLTHDTLLTSASKAVNTAMTVRNWLYGYYIVEYEQNGEDRAKYGARLLKELAENIPVKGISETNLRIFRQFYLTYPAISHTLSDLLKQVPIIQAVPEQFAVSEADTIHRTLSDILPEITGIPIRQTVSDKFQVIDIESIQQDIPIDVFVSSGSETPDAETPSVPRGRGKPRMKTALWRYREDGTYDNRPNDKAYFAKYMAMRRECTCGRMISIGDKYKHAKSKICAKLTAIRMASQDYDS